MTGRKGIIEDLTLSLHDRHGHIDSLYPTITGRKLVTFPSQKVGDLSKEKTREVQIQFETNLIEKISTESWPCQKENVNDYCLEEHVEDKLQCYLPWGLGLGVDKQNWCYDARSLDMILSTMPDERSKSKSELIDHIKEIGCSFSCRYIAYKPIIVYDKYYKDTFPSGDRKTRLFLKIGPKNEDRNYLKEFYVYGWADFFADMGSYIGLLLGWSFLTILEMAAEFIEILNEKKLTLRELIAKKIQANNLNN